jgi:hypothetical protein
METSVGRRREENAAEPVEGSAAAVGAAVRREGLAEALGDDHVLLLSV